MQEIVPLVAGVAIAFLTQHFGAGPLSKAIALLVCSAAIGAVASFVSGELFVSWTFLAIDFALTLFAAGLMMALLATRQRWLPHRRHIEQHKDSSRTTSIGYRD
jgi:high-affinity Fe2+/Pb2+ permease